MLGAQEFIGVAQRYPEVESSSFAEWLLDTFAICGKERSPMVADETVLLKFSHQTNGFQLQSQDVRWNIPIARLEWFDIRNVGPEGLPTTISSSNSVGHWKFWSLGSTELISGAMRSFVTYSGTCSLDLGTPVYAQHPIVMNRECYPRIEAPIPLAILPIWERHEKLTHARDDAGLKEFLVLFDDSDLLPSQGCDLLELEELAEMLADLRGKRTLVTSLDITLKQVNAIPGSPLNCTQQISMTTHHFGDIGHPLQFQAHRSLQKLTHPFMWPLAAIYL